MIKKNDLLKKKVKKTKTHHSVLKTAVYSPDFHDYKDISRISQYIIFV